MNEKEYLDYIEEWKKQNKDLIDSGKCRKVFLECLPRGGKGKNNGNISLKNINWFMSIGKSVYFLYEDIENRFEIIGYNESKQELKIKQDDTEYYIKTSVVKKNHLGKIIKKITSEFKVEIGQIFKDNKRDLTIIDREYRKEKNGTDKRKWYKYKCNKCGWSEGWMIESLLLRNQNCSCCESRTVVEGINDIPTTAPWMVKYFQGGYDEAKQYTKGSGQKIRSICPNCGKIKDKDTVISSIYKNHSIGCICEDTVSFPEKFMFNILEQLEVDSITQLTRKNFKWCKDYRYDFYFEKDEQEYIIETHGIQHYENNTQFKETLGGQQQNDKLKKELAIKNGIKEKNYIVIDCRKSELDWVKENVLNSKLNEIFDLSNIDWIKCEEFALSNIIKMICNLKNNNKNITTAKIVEISGYSQPTVDKWLKIGNELG
ncbi:hypothetical protein [Clostridium sp. VAP52]|uniref:hypothetical protein n=1 Tax=Clostridium sp. VAP52 TaxID=2949977 RepID=UPI00207A5CAA|nr:hypothetical protein [Clostridium sp. VAP52]